MKVKLLKIRTHSVPDGEYDDIIKHIVSDYSDFEECSNLSALSQFVQEYNLSARDGTYLLIAEETCPISIKSAVQTIIDQITKRKEAHEERMRKEKEEKAAKYAAGAAKRAEKRRVSLEKQLAKLKEQEELIKSKL